MKGTKAVNKLVQRGILATKYKIQINDIQMNLIQSGESQTVLAVTYSICCHRLQVSCTRLLNQIVTPYYIQTT